MKCPNDISEIVQYCSIHTRRFFSGNNFVTNHVVGFILTCSRPNETMSSITFTDVQYNQKNEGKILCVPYGLWCHDWIFVVDCGGPVGYFICGVRAEPCFEERARCDATNEEVGLAMETTSNTPTPWS